METSLICPACGRALARRAAGPVVVDACEGGCGGVWFDHFELRKLDEQAEPVGAELLELTGDAPVGVDRERRHRCPRCADGVVLMRHFWSVRRAIAVDECPQCGGMWLDAGELEAIRSEFRTEAARHAAADAEFSRVFDGRLAAEQAESRAELERARRIAHALRLITPSWYLPGKQAGGAF